MYPETREGKYARVKKLYEAQKAAVKDDQPAGSLVCEIKLTHNFVVTKTCLLIDPSRTPDGGKYCCLSHYKLEKQDDGSVTSTLLIAENDDHV